VLIFLSGGQSFILLKLKWPLPLEKKVPARPEFYFIKIKVASETEKKSGTDPSFILLKLKLPLRLKKNPAQTRVLFY